MALNAEDYIPALKYGATINSADDINLPNAQILVGNSSGVAANVAMSGDATMANTGAVTIANNAVTNAKIANSTIAGAKLLPGAGYFMTCTTTNGTTPVNIFGAGGAPCALTITGVFVIARDTTAGNITPKQGSNTVCTIAKGTSSGVAVGGATLSNTTYAASDVATVVSSSAGNADVFITWTYA